MLKWKNLEHIGLCLLFLILIGCHEVKLKSQTVSHLEETFQAVVDKVVSYRNDRIFGVNMHVEAPTFGISWTGVSGVSEVSTQKPLAVSDPFRIASVTKTFTAAAILRLMEEGQLSLDDPISLYISKNHTQILKDGGYQPNEITIRHCLNHTSGLFDYAMGTDTFRLKLTADPKRRWTRTDQIEGAMVWGRHMDHPETPTTILTPGIFCWVKSLKY